jgi:hypothetical protein
MISCQCVVILRRVVEWKFSNTNWLFHKGEHSILSRLRDKERTTNSKKWKEIWNIFSLASERDCSEEQRFFKTFFKREFWSLMKSFIKGNRWTISICFEEICELSSKVHNCPNDLIVSRKKEPKKHETNDLMSRGHSRKDIVLQFATENESMKVWLPVVHRIQNRQSSRNDRGVSAVHKIKMTSTQLISFQFLT